MVDPNPDFKSVAPDDEGSDEYGQLSNKWKDFDMATTCDFC